MAKVEGGPVAFREAIDFYKQKVRLPTKAWTDLWHGMHARAFVIAGATKDELLKDFHDAVTRAIAEGRTLADFRKDFDAIVKRHGWDYKGGRGWRSAVIYNTNMRMAFAAGKWDQIQRVKERRPYLRYSAILDSGTRDDHRTWHGTVLPVDHPWWATHYPPNGWGCRCTIQQLSAADVTRLGYRVSDAAPEVRPVARTITVDGRKVDVTVPEGIDPGFDYNVGQAAWGTRIDEHVMENWRKQPDRWQRLTPGDWQSADRPREVPKDASPTRPSGVPAEDKDSLRAAIETVIGGKEKVFVLPGKAGAVTLNAEVLAGHVALRRAEFLPFLPEGLTDPYEVWLAFERDQASGKVELRKRIIKIIDYGGGRTLTMVAQVVKGRFEAWTFVPSDRLNQVNRSRVGKLLYGRDGDLADAADGSPGDG